jgi:hypothetical protein
MNFGFTGCHSSMPSMQRLAVYTAEALADMEATFMPQAKAPAPARKPKPAVTKVAVTKVAAEKVAVAKKVTVAKPKKVVKA